MTFRDAIRRATVAPAEEKVLCLLSHIGDAKCLMFHEDMLGPVLVLWDGRKMAYDGWEQWDALCERKWIEVSEGRRRAALTWAGQKALNAWHKRGGRAG